MVVGSKFCLFTKNDDFIQCESIIISHITKMVISHIANLLKAWWFHTMRARFHSVWTVRNNVNCNVKSQGEWLCIFHVVWNHTRLWNHYEGRIKIIPWEIAMIFTTSCPPTSWDASLPLMSKTVSYTWTAAVNKSAYRSSSRPWPCIEPQI